MTHLDHAHPDPADPPARSIFRRAIQPYPARRPAQREDLRDTSDCLPDPRRLQIELTYGPDADWHKNIVAAGGCTVVHRGQAYVIDQIAQVDTQTGLAAFPSSQRFVLRLLRRTHFEKLFQAAALIRAVCECETLRCHCETTSG